jgi:hypothetical protein
MAVEPPSSHAEGEVRVRQNLRILSRHDVGRIHAKVRDTRRDVQHKATSAVVKAASVVVTETLNVKGMIRNGRLSLSDLFFLWSGRHAEGYRVVRSHAGL